LRGTIASLLAAPSAGADEIGPLERPELAALIEAIEGERPSSTTLLMVAERSMGNPLLAEEILAARRELSGSSLPNSFDRLVSARAALRSPECLRVLRLLSMTGSLVGKPTLHAMAEEFDARSSLRPRRSALVARSGDALEAELASGLAEAIEHGFLVEARGGQPREGVAGPKVQAAVAGREPRSRRAERESRARERSRSGRTIGLSAEDPGRSNYLKERAAAQAPDRDSRYGFRHELIAEAIAADLLPATRRRYHSALAAAYDGEPDAQAYSAMAHHLEANELAEVEITSLEAAASAEALDSGADALVRYERALGLYEIVGAVEGGASLTDLYIRAAESALAAGCPARSVSYAEAAAARLDDPREKPALCLVMEHLGRYRRATGDSVGALLAYRRAVDLVPPEPTHTRARVLASLAQFRMLEGVFSEAKRYAQEALEVANSVGEEARLEQLHAGCTLAVADAWGEDPEPAVWKLRQLRDETAAIGDIDGLFRVYANLTTVLDLLGRRDEALAIALEGIAEAEKVGQATVYGSFLRSNAADSLFYLGRWPESRQFCLDALSWNPTGPWYLSPLLDLTRLEVATTAGESAGRLLVRVLTAIETIGDPQFVVPAHQAAAAYALWQDDINEAHRSAELGWLRVSDTEDWILMARMAEVYLEVDAAVVADAHRRRDPAALTDARERSLPVLLRAEAVVRACGVSPKTGSRQQADLSIRTARAFRFRLEGNDDPDTWHQLAVDWAAINRPYESARAFWREAEAIVERADGQAPRGAARGPLVGAAEAALKLGAWPFLRAVSELAGRAAVPLPKAVEAALAGTIGKPADSRRSAGARGGAAGKRGAAAVGPVAVEFAAVSGEPVRRDFGLSARELEVLALIAEGLTNLEIGRRLLISPKTVGAHVGSILAKLGVSGRVEAATTAIRMGLAGRD
jgi:DNA-binding CsgD family transcriptional regulator/tetratricopeptide (TPR) repeat protein